MPWIFARHLRQLSDQRSPQHLGHIHGELALVRGLDHARKGGVRHALHAGTVAQEPLRHQRQICEVRRHLPTWVKSGRLLI